MPAWFPTGCSLAPLGNIVHGFATAACNAGMGTLQKVKRKRKQRNDKEVWENVPHADMAPHVLRHTCIRDIIIYLAML